LILSGPTFKLRRKFHPIVRFSFSVTTSDVLPRYQVNLVRVNQNQTSLKGTCPLPSHSSGKVRLSYDSTSMRNAEALAFAQPYEGTIVVFLDRVQELNRNGGPSVVEPSSGPPPVRGAPGPRRPWFRCS
jgi:hypothetical protein